MCRTILKLELLFLISAVGCFKEQGVVLNSAYSFPNIATCIRMLFLIDFSPKTEQESNTKLGKHSEIDLR